MILKKLALVSVFLFSPVVLFAMVTSSINDSTSLKTWKLMQNGFELQLVQRLPDQTRGFFQGRGFTKQQANDIATQCVFQTIVKNTALDKTSAPIEISLKEWRVKVNGMSKHIKLKEDWAKQWSLIQNKSDRVKKSAQIAFRWATFPSEQTFDPGGDYNWGMISFALKPGQVFDLHVFWHVGEQINDEWITSLECPRDI